MKSIIRVVAGVIFVVGLLASARVMGQAVNITGEWAFTVQKIGRASCRERV